MYVFSQDDRQHNVNSDEGHNPLGENNEKNSGQLQDLLNSSKLFIPSNTPRFRYINNVYIIENLI